jgi:hypothetical protein
VINDITKIKGKQFTVIVHAIGMHKIEITNLETTLTNLQTQDLQLKDKVKCLKPTWTKKTLKLYKLQGLLLINVGIPEKANMLVL